MASKTLALVLLFQLLVNTGAFASLGSSQGARHATQLQSYLESLGQPGAVASFAPPAPAAAAPVANGNVAPASPFPYVPLSDFAVSNLESKGPRATADWGTPADATAKLGNYGCLSGGTWFCTEGGWPSPNEKAHTEVFYVLSGFGSLDDADGARHYFGPGDTVIIPKGHTGRWDVNQAIHKVWAVNAHEQIEDKSPIIRVQVDHYNSFASELLSPVENGYDPLYGTTAPVTGSVAPSAKTFYNVGPTQVGVWSSRERGSFAVQSGKASWIYILEGVAYITMGRESRRCVAGDSVLLPAGWSGHVDVVEPVKKLWTTAAV
mmetsp:Transcript_14076/g.21379  ORF Transcript_14076/g.21379 Transcript_14076/m.21379 type:complete len:320 (+) Transcript_14076:365-1324(+)